VAGPVEILSIYGVVTTILGANLTLPHLEVHDGAATVALTANGAAISTLVPVSWLGKVGDAADALVVQSAAAPALIEPAQAWVCRPFLVVPNSQVDTVIRFGHTSAGATSGAIRWRIAYIPHGLGGISAA